jgi:hypothetical protein
VLAHAGRYELVPEPDVRQSSTNRVASAYLIDKASEFWICTARYKAHPRERLLMAQSGRSRECPLPEGYCCKSRLVSIAGLRYEF